MHRRRFLEIVTRVGAGVGAGVPLLGKLTSSVDASEKKSAKSTNNAQQFIMPLDEGWSIDIDPDNVGRDQAWFHTQSSGAKPTRIPAIIQQHFPTYHGVAWYWLEFRPQSHPLAGGRSLLRFCAVDYLAGVWLNGTYLGSHEGGETPFLFDVTGAIHPGQRNLLAVRVLNPGSKEIDGIILAETAHRNKVAKFSNGSLFDFGGIIAPVDLLFTPSAHISDLFVSTDWQTGQIIVESTISSSSKAPIQGQMHFAVGLNESESPIFADAITISLPPGETKVRHQMTLAHYQLWALDSPSLYQLSVVIESSDMDGSDQADTQFAFRDFRIINGYFHLNGKRLFLKCTHTGNHAPFGQVNPPDNYPDLLRLDLLYARASGFNTVRFISGVAHPYQLDLCDQLGLLVYEESSASWLLKDSPQMKTRYENSLREMILRDRNHPCIVIWGLLNETEDGPVFREAVSALPLVRSLDQTRLLLLSSGRFDGHLEVGSACNPGNSEWEHVWGKEAPGAAHVAMSLPSGPGTGDFHLYPSVPQTPETNKFMRTLGEGSKPVFLSEYGIGSMMNVIHEAKMYEQAGIPENAEDFVLMKSMADKLIADWIKFAMEAAYPYPEILLQMSQRKMASHRLLGFNLIRSNPMICGFNLTGMLDHAMTGEGIWRFWRDWKPELFDAMRDGWAPVRWCLFVEPTHTYVGRPITFEAVLANEDIVRPGEYPAHFRAWGPNGTSWDKHSVIFVPNTGKGDGPLAIPVMKEQTTLSGPAGSYELIPHIPNGIAPPETSWPFYLSDPASLPRIDRSIVTWGIPTNVASWLTSHGAEVRSLESSSAQDSDVILVGNVSAEHPTARQWTSLAERIATGSTVVFLSHLAFERDGNSSSWLPTAAKGRIYKFTDWLYHKECVAKPHPVFEGLQGSGILDWGYYGPLVPSYLFDGQETPQEVIAAAFAAGYSTAGGYASGVLLGQYKFGNGQFLINSFPILDHIDQHPVADRLLLNLVKYSATLSHGAALARPADFDSLLRRIGYAN